MVNRRKHVRERAKRRKRFERACLAELKKYVLGNGTQSVVKWNDRYGWREELLK